MSEKAARLRLASLNEHPISRMDEGKGKMKKRVAVISLFLFRFSFAPSPFPFYSLGRLFVTFPPIT
jgi:hypothetical protein